MRHARRWLLGPLYAQSFLSGIAALVYQTVWAKLLGLTFGSSTLATSATIAGFMGGMGIGAFLYHRLRRRVSDPLRIYGLLELGICVSAALLTATLYWLPAAFGNLARSIPQHDVLEWVRIVGVLALLAPPSMLMGATFPALCSAAITSSRTVDTHLGGIYGANTLGAASGALLSGLLLIEVFGLARSAGIAIALNLAIGVSALALSMRSPPLPESEASEIEETSLPSSMPVWVTAVVLGASGLSTLAYEVLWFRGLRYLFGNSTYALSAILFAFLAGLGLGALLLQPVVRRVRPEIALAWCQIGIAVLALAGFASLAAVLSSDVAQNSLSIFAATVYQRDWWLRLLTNIGVSAVMMLPATLLMGLSFPLASRLFLNDVRLMDRRLGVSVLLANAGSIFGALGVALVLLPRYGTLTAVRIVAFCNIALAVLVVLSQQRERARRSIYLGSAAASILLATLLPSRFEIRNAAGLEFPRHLRFEQEGELGTVQVWQSNADPAVLGMSIDGTPIGVSSDVNYPMFSKQLLLAHLPASLDRELASTLNVGLGSASTVAALGTHSQVREIDVVEINPTVVRASHHFPDAAILRDPRTVVIVEDALHELLRSSKQYDLIVSDGKQSVDYAGNARILSREFYEAALARLSKDGIFLQWIALHGLPSDFATTLRTFTHVFPEVEVFLDAPYSVILVGSRAPIGGRAVVSDDEFAESRARQDLELLGIPNVAALRARWVASRSGLLAVLGAGPLSTWDHSELEFSAYKSRPSAWERGKLTNIQLLLEAGRLTSPEARSRMVRADDPFVISQGLLRESYVSQFESDLDKAARLARKAAIANPEDSAAVRRRNELAHRPQ